MGRTLSLVCLLGILGSCKSTDDLSRLRKVVHDTCACESRDCFDKTQAAGKAILTEVDLVALQRKAPDETTKLVDEMTRCALAMAEKSGPSAASK